MPRPAVHRINDLSRHQARVQVDRELHTLVVRATDGVRAHVPAAHQDWAFDLRRGRLRIYGGLLRFIDLLHARGFSKAVALEIVAALVWYIDQTWKEPCETRVLEWRKAA